MGPGYKYYHFTSACYYTSIHLETVDTLEISVCDILCSPGTKYVRREFTPDPKLGLEGLQWDSADLYMVRWEGEGGRIS